MASLSEFLAPISHEAVLTRKQRQELPFQVGESTWGTLDLMSWDTLIDIACRIADPDELQITSNRNDVPFKFILTDGRVDRAKLEKLVARGASLVVHNAHRYDDRLGALVREFMEASGKKAWLGVIGSTGAVGALIRHSDPYDIFIRQVEGAKEWRIYSSDSDDADLRARHTLKAGDYLYLPAGHAHDCDTLGGRSLHLGLGFAGPKYDVWG